jgi:hypothetical protein
VGEGGGGAVFFIFLGNPGFEAFLNHYLPP